MHCSLGRKSSSKKSLTHTFYTFSKFRDYPASATCLKIKNTPVPELSICFSCTDPSTRAAGLLLGTPVPRNTYSWILF